MESVVQSGRRMPYLCIQAFFVMARLPCCPSKWRWVGRGLGSEMELDECGKG